MCTAQAMITNLIPIISLKYTAIWDTVSSTVWSKTTHCRIWSKVAPSRGSHSTKRTEGDKADEKGNEFYSIEKLRRMSIVGTTSVRDIIHRSSDCLNHSEQEHIAWLPFHTSTSSHLILVLPVLYHRHHHHHHISVWPHLFSQQSNPHLMRIIHSADG